MNSYTRRPHFVHSSPAGEARAVRCTPGAQETLRVRGSPMNETPNPPKPWWETMPGILTGVAAVITALGGLLALYIRSQQPKSVTSKDSDAVPDTSAHRDTVFLSDQPPADISAEPHGGLGRDKAYWTEKVVLNGRQIRKSLVMHANAGSPAVVGFDLAEPYSRFEAIVGLIEPRCEGRGSATFTVLIDGDKRFTSQFALRPAGVSSVPLRRARTLTLEVDDGGRERV